MRHTRLPYLVGALAITLGTTACEDGPEQIYEPNEGDTTDQNGHSPAQPWFQDGDKDYSGREGTADEVGRARFCSEEENEALIQWMVTQPIIPDVSIGGVPMWTADERPIFADDLLGKPADFTAPDVFCDPQEYLDGFVWGPTQEVIYIFDVDTRFVQYVVAYSQYLGNMDGTYTREAEGGGTEQVPVKVRVRDRIFLEDRELDQYSSRADQASKPNAWTNTENVNAIYRMIRETYFGVSPADLDYDCVETKICNILYQSEEAQATPQQVSLYIVDSGVQLTFAPDGYLQYVLLEPVRVAPFETATEVTLGPEGEEEVDAKLTSLSKPECVLSMSNPYTWAEFKQRCVGSDDRILDRINYTVGGQRDTVTLDFQGITVGFQRDIAEKPLLGDGERPHDDDKLYRLVYTRQSRGTVAEFVPKQLAMKYRERLLQRLRDAVRQPPKDDEGAGGGPEEPGGDPGADGGMDPIEQDAGMEPPEADAGMADGDMEPVENDAGVDAPEPDMGEPPVEPEEPELEPHPFLTFDLAVPETLPEEPTPLDKLAYGPANALNFTNTAIEEVRAAYDALTPEQQALVDPRVIEPTWIIEPYVEVILEAFTHGMVNRRFAFQAMQIPDNRNFVVGLAHFIQDGVPYRMEVHYSMFYGELSAVVISTGFNSYDEILTGWNNQLREPEGLGQPAYPYYSLDLATHPENPFRLGGDGVRVLDFDRENDTLDIQVVQVNADGERELIDLTVNGIPASDNHGYLRQIRGERYEFVPANVVNLSGRETSLVVYVEEGNRIGYLRSGGFKRPMNLCPGLRIEYGDDVRERVEAWRRTQGINAYRECELVFNYSPNGNVLDSVTSITNRISFTTTNGRATQVDMWR